MILTFKALDENENVEINAAAAFALCMTTIFT
jgi:hypothetical protein